MPAPRWMTPWRWGSMEKARKRDDLLENKRKDEPRKPPRSWSFDPKSLAWVYSGEAPSEAHPGTLGLDYGTLMTVARIPVIGAILQTRIQQVGEFAQPQPSPYSVGFKVKLREARKEPTKAQQKRIEEIERLIMHAGGKYQVGGFDTFLRMMTRDSLTYDQANAEIIARKGNSVAGKVGEPWGFVPVDAATIRKARPTEAMLKRGRWDPDKVSYIQIIEHKVRNEYRHHEMLWGIRRPRSWIYSNGYGYPEIEELLSIVTDLMNAQTFNSANFRTGIHSQSLLALFSTMDDAQFRAVQRTLISGMHGPRNSKRLAMIQLNPGVEGQPKDDLRAIPLSQSNKDMEYSNWLNWLLKISCACYQMDPAELGFTFGNEGQTGSLSQAGPAERIWASKERGLRPLLRSIQQWLNEWVVYPTDEDYELEFVGFDSLSESAKLDLDTKAVRAFKTVNEVRAEHDLEPIEGEIGDLILDSTFYQAWSQMRMEEQQAEQGGMGGEDMGGGGMWPPGGEDEAEAEGQMFQVGEEGPPEGGEEGGFEPLAASQAADVLTRDLAVEFQQAADEGRLITKGRKGRKLGRWVPIPTTKRGTDRVRAYVVEVD